VCSDGAQDEGDQLNGAGFQYVPLGHWKESGMKSRLRIVATGLIAQHPLLGGVTWFYLQYLTGLARLGHDVYYLEDSGEWPYNTDGGPTGDHWVADDPAPNVDHLARVMARFGLEGKWAYRFPTEPRWFGMPLEDVEQVLKSADLLLNVSGTLEHPERYRLARKSIYIDTDPVFTQVRYARGVESFRRQVDAHDMHFSYAECLPNDSVPSTGHFWRPTRAPIVLSEWEVDPRERSTFTTIMNWTSYDAETFQGKVYGQKDMEFKRFMDLPEMVAPAVLELAIGAGKNDPTPYDLLSSKGWKLSDPFKVCNSLDAMRDYTRSSKAEWSVAKHGYVAGNSGWFSERSARYLAVGRPVVVQDTGFSAVIPVGEGVLAFNNIEEAAEGIRAIESDYPAHSRAARAIAERYFDSDKVLAPLIEEAMSN
jgi:hypothetical protein